MTASAFVNSAFVPEYCSYCRWSIKDDVIRRVGEKEKGNKNEIQYKFYNSTLSLTPHKTLFFNINKKHKERESSGGIRKWDEPKGEQGEGKPFYVS